MADRFGISESTVSRVLDVPIAFRTRASHPVALEGADVYFIPAIFTAKYPAFVVIIDCTEIKMESLS